MLPVWVLGIRVKFRVFLKKNLWHTARYLGALLCIEGQCRALLCHRTPFQSQSGHLKEYSISSMPRSWPRKGSFSSTMTSHKFSQSLILWLRPAVKMEFIRMICHWTPWAVVAAQKPFLWLFHAGSAKVVTEKKNYVVFKLIMLQWISGSFILYQFGHSRAQGCKFVATVIGFLCLKTLPDPPETSERQVRLWSGPEVLCLVRRS